MAAMTNKMVVLACPRCGGRIRAQAQSGYKVYCGCGDHHTLMVPQDKDGRDWLRLPTYEEYRNP
jgi:hypothetical protein